MIAGADIQRVLAAAAFAAECHRDQRRRGCAADGTDNIPYVNHVLDVAHRVSQSSHGLDDVLIQGALLHDIVEDTDHTAEDIRALFGADVMALVLEVTDDKSLPKADRKRLQVEKIAGKSDRAKRLKLADKASNVTSIADAPPDWPHARKAAYLDWAEAVVAGCRGVDPALEDAFDAALTHARKVLRAAA